MSCFFTSPEMVFWEKEAPQLFSPEGSGLNILATEEVADSSFAVSFFRPLTINDYILNRFYQEYAQAYPDSALSVIKNIEKISSENYFFLTKLFYWKRYQNQTDLIEALIKKTTELLPKCSGSLGIRIFIAIKYFLFPQIIASAPERAAEILQKEELWQTEATQDLFLWNFSLLAKWFSDHLPQIKLSSQSFTFCQQVFTELLQAPKSKLQSLVPLLAQIIVLQNKADFLAQQQEIGKKIITSFSQPENIVSWLPFVKKMLEENILFFGQEDFIFSYLERGFEYDLDEQIPYSFAELCELYLRKKQILPAGDSKIKEVVNNFLAKDSFSLEKRRDFSNRTVFFEIFSLLSQSQEKNWGEKMKTLFVDGFPERFPLIIWSVFADWFPPLADEEIVAIKTEFTGNQQGQTELLTALLFRNQKYIQKVIQKKHDADGFLIGNTQKWVHPYRLLEKIGRIIQNPVDTAKIVFRYYYRYNQNFPRYAQMRATLAFSPESFPNYIRSILSKDAMEIINVLCESIQEEDFDCQTPEIIEALQKGLKAFSPKEKISHQIFFEKIFELLLAKKKEKESLVFYNSWHKEYNQYSKNG